MYYLEHDEHQDNQHLKTVYKSSESLSGDKNDSRSTVMSATASRSSVTNQHPSQIYHRLFTLNSNKYSTFDNLPGSFRFFS